MAVNPLKVLVELQAKKGAIISGSAGEGLVVQHGMEVGGAADLKSTLDVSGAVDLASTLDVAGASTFAGAVAAQAGATVTGAALDASAVAVSASSLSVTNDAYVGGKLTVQGDLEVLGNLNAIDRTTLTVSDLLITAASGAVNAAAADGGGLKIAGAEAELVYAAIDDSWNLNKKVNLSSDLAVAGSGSVSGDLSVTGVSTLGGAVTAEGNLTAEGSLEVDGTANIDGAVTMHNGLTIDGAQLDAQNGASITGGLTLTDTGLTISGGGATITGAVSASSDMNAGGNLSVAGTSGFSGAATMASTLDVDGAVDFDSTLDVSGAVNFASTLGVAGAATLSSTLNVQGAADFDAAVNVDSDLTVLASGSLTVITGAESAGYYNVAKAIKLLDSNVGDNKQAAIDAYEAVRLQVGGAFASGQATVNLTTSGESGIFDAASIDYIALDVMVKDASGEWSNDLVAVHMFLDGANVKVQIDALTEATHYRLLAVNEKAGKFSW